MCIVTLRNYHRIADNLFVTAGMHVFASRNLIFEVNEILIMKDTGEECAGVLECIHNVGHNTATVL
jgi:hypothetical protein